VWTVAVIAAIGAGAIMFDSVPQEISIHATLVALAGTMLSATLALALIALAGAAAQRQWLGIAVRIAGSWTAASAILVLALRLAK
jgi:hypothetical protein